MKNGIGRPMECLSEDGTQQRCSRCREFKPLTDFHRNRSSETGYNRECKPCRLDYLKARHQPEYIRRRNLKVKYGITPEQYDEMRDAQGGKCAICGRLEEEERYERLSVDHDHDTGEVRGLLCQSCNIAIGKMGDNPERLQKAIDYLKKVRN